MPPARIYTAQGIILKRKSVGEADRILTVFTKQYGKVRVLAKGVRRIKSRRAGHIEVFSRVVFTIHKGKTMDMVSEAVQAASGRFADTSITTMSYAYYLCELVDQLLPEQEAHVEVFHMLARALDAFSREQDEVKLERYIGEFTHRLLWMLGYLAPDKRLSGARLRPFVESITERKSKTLLLLTKLGSHAYTKDAR